MEGWFVLENEDTIVVTGPGRIIEILVDGTIMFHTITQGPQKPKLRVVEGGKR